MNNKDQVKRVSRASFDNSRRGKLGAFPSDLSSKEKEGEISQEQINASRRGTLGAFPDKG